MASRSALRALRRRLGGATASAALVAGVAAALLLGGCTSPDHAAVSRPDARVVAAAITEEGLRARLEELAEATGAADGFRSVGSPGYDAAAALVERELAAAGWSVHSDRHEDMAFVDDRRSSLAVEGQVFGVDDVRPLILAPGGDVTGPVVSLVPSAADVTGRGCRASEYGAIPSAAIVLVGPGDCLRREQVIAAQQAGAAAFVAVSHEASPGVVLRPTLLDPRGLAIPAAAVSQRAAKALLEAATARGTAHLVTTARSEQVPSRTVLAELEGSRDGPVVMLGAHLDSVIDGPGVNDNASGVAGLLEVARALRGAHPQATVRLAFWSGEELGLHGSLRYVSALSPAEKQAIVVYANVDMIASPNGFAGVYDEANAAAGSSNATRLLIAAVRRNGGAPVPVDLHNGSDHYGFVEAGVATAGVFSGSMDPVTPEQAAGSGVAAGQPADRCYHQPCDDLSNVDLGVGRVLVAGLADFTVQVANSPELLRP